MKCVFTVITIWIGIAGMVQADTISPSEQTIDSSMLALADPGQADILWEECNMKPDGEGVLECYRLMSDLSEQYYYFKDDVEYPGYPLSNE